MKGNKIKRENYQDRSDIYLNKISAGSERVKRAEVVAKEDNKIQSSVLGTSGEYLVLSKLLLKGFVAGLAPEFTKDFDIVVVSKDGKHSAPIQVKTTTSSDMWRMDRKHESEIENLIYCFVKIDEQTHETEFFIIDSKTVSYALSMSHKIWLKLPSVRKDVKTDSKMRVLKRDYKKLSPIPTVLRKLREGDKDLSEFLSERELNFLSNFSEGWMENYRNAWDTIKTK